MQLYSQVRETKFSIFISSFWPASRISCSHVPSIFYALVLVVHHWEDVNFPEWLRPYGLEGYEPHQLDHIGITVSWPHKLHRIFGPLEDGIPARGGPQNNTKKWPWKIEHILRELIWPPLVSARFILHQYICQCTCNSNKYDGASTIPILWFTHHILISDTDHYEILLTWVLQ